MSDNKKKKPMTAADYIKNQPHLQGKHLTQKSTQNTFSVLAEFPPLNYANTVKASTQGQTSAQNQPSTPENHSEYFTKPYNQHLHTTHFPKPTTLKDLTAYVNRVFYETAPWPTDNVTKNQTFYEYILVDSMSAQITHSRNSQNPDQIDYSTCKIIRIASYQDLGFQSLHTQKPFNNPGFHIPGYTYTDYINAFFRAFLYRPFNHSWFIQFQFNCPKTIPGWFYEWWYWFGPTDQIYPQTIIQNSLPTYQKYLPKPQIPILSKIAFHIDMGVPWICSWHFHLIQLQENMPMSLVRQYRVKWWIKYELERCSPTNIQKFFATNKKIEDTVKQVSRSIPTHDSRENARQLIQLYGSHPQPSRPQSSGSVSSTKSGSSSQATKKKLDKKQQLKEMLAMLQDQLNDDDEEMDEAQPFSIPSPINIEDDDDPFGGPLAQDPNE